MTQFPASGLFRELPGGAWAAVNATITGNLDLGPEVNIWFGCVLRGDDASIHIGARTNVQDLTICLLYTSPSPRDQRGSRMPSSA